MLRRPPFSSVLVQIRKFAGMDQIVKKAIQHAETQKRVSVQWKVDEPWHQPWFAWNLDEAQWVPRPPFPRLEDGTKRLSKIKNLALFSWNIDFMLPFPEERMKAALAHLRDLTEPILSTEDTAVVILLQECIPSDLTTIGQESWIQKDFCLTDLHATYWASGAYGTTMLVDRRLQIASCFRVHYSATRMERDGLFVDINVPTSAGSSKTIRVCNTHLESLALEPPFRPLQMGLIAKHMHAEKISGAIVAGDFNAIQPSDDSLHTDNNLKDAYLELGGEHKAEEGHTWGQQALPAQRKQFGCSRMDKAFFCGESLSLRKFERFGMDVVIADDKEEEKKMLLSLGFEKPWVTDHLGISALFSLKLDHHL